MRVKNCRKTRGSQFLPRGIKMSRRAFCVSAVAIAIAGNLLRQSAFAGHFCDGTKIWTIARFFPSLSGFGLKNAGSGFFAYGWKLPAYSGAFLLTTDNYSFFTYSWSFFAYCFSFFTYSWSFFAYSGKVHLIRALRDCKQRSLTVSKKNSTCK